MDILAVSVWLRYLEICGVSVPFPPNAYQGDYVITMAQSLHARDGGRYARSEIELAALPNADPEQHLDLLIATAKRELAADYAGLHAYALNTQLEDCRSDLAEFGVKFDCWYSERSLFDSGKVERAVAALEAAGHLYAKDGASWFQSTVFGDEKDRVVRRENGQFTYFASDIAYHLDKIDRGFNRMIDVWGADHHGYIPRVKVR